MVFFSTPWGIPGWSGVRGTASHEPWYAPVHLAIRGLAVLARATLMACMLASVPVGVKRIVSVLRRVVSSSASSGSVSVGAPSTSPFFICSLAALMGLGWLCPRISVVLL